jgi:hypothetical protein
MSDPGRVAEGSRLLEVMPIAVEKEQVPRVGRKITLTHMDLQRGIEESNHGL